ncbi:MAG TPA: hypothetical protein VFI25_02575 [Planctomycetota bacterium]|jgi:hypothetical protein|nr:hypothetical protein [Planctomycetota bacterium]
MNVLSIVSCCLALVGTAQVASGQRVSLRGKVDQVPPPRQEFFVDGTSTLLRSPTIDLGRFVGEQVEIDGYWNGSSMRPWVDVRTIASVRQSFAIGDKRSIGGDAHVAAFGNPGEPAFLGGALQSTFVPIAGDGTLFIGPQGILPFGAGRIDATGKFEVTVPIPNDRALVGLTVYGQAAILAGGTTILLTNPDWMTITK